MFKLRSMESFRFWQIRRGVLLDMLADPDWLCKGLFGRPTRMYAATKKAPIKTKKPRPVGEIACLAVERESVVCPFVSRLSAHRDPSAVGGRIASVVVLALNGVTNPRRRSHVRQEVLEAEPAFANADAASFIVFIVAWFVSIVSKTATNLHVPPASELLTVATGRTPVGVVQVLYLLISKATAAFRVSSAKVICIHENEHPAIALTKPASFCIAGGRYVLCDFNNNGQPPVSLPRKVKKPHVATLSSDVTGTRALSRAFRVPPLYAEPAA